VDYSDQGVEHDNINVLVLGGRIVGAELAHELIGAFIQCSLQRRGAPPASKSDLRPPFLFLGSFFSLNAAGQIQYACASRQEMT
jgi:hypothetical protein